MIDDLNKHLFVKRPDRRTKLIPIRSGDVIVNVIPETVDVESVAYELKDRTPRRHGWQRLEYGREGIRLGLSAAGQTTNHPNTT